MNTACSHGKKRRFEWIILLILLPISACGGGPSEESEYNPPPYDYQSSDWDRFDVINLESAAAINPNVQARKGHDGRIHIFYYKRGAVYEGNQTRYQIHYLVWDPQTMTVDGEPEIVPVQPPNPGDAEDSDLNNCLILDAAVDTFGLPVIAYQGGDIPQADDGTICNLTAQGDLMVNWFDGADWDEYLGIMGDASAKNPYFTDGYIGVAASIALDSRNGIHMCGQHYYEFCDWNSTNYPDLLYVRRPSGQLGSYSTALEEHVDDFNIYGNGGGVQSDMGYHCRLVLDSNDNPFIFYVGTPVPDGISDNHPALRMASKPGGQWVPESIEILDTWQVEWLSGAVDPAGRPAVAYFMQDIDQQGDYPDHLRYASRDGDGLWSVAVVDNSAQCGDFCTLAFDTQGRPAIAYYDISARSATYRSHKDLKFAWLNGGQWRIETVATAGDIGQYNSLWFDADNTAFICTYELNEQQIVIFSKQIQ